ncbi:uncharacterized protein LOC126841413 isoform X5 [Adelges cooleyi]|uniref:uncharacterized protein LOC126841413 isoform X4 n=1 Tax=Adelges cooleyi TaxID=133065 RepID=UPI00217FB871|nr:uncharacterized protein LOC126841413 isoform X4 [Adelges cooleyi]XP_050433846.1 uncharacterized protein LOC126841413 isoform X5 [Adelges cooleyi]
MQKFTIYFIVFIIMEISLVTQGRPYPTSDEELLKQEDLTEPQRNLVTARDVPIEGDSMESQKNLAVEKKRSTGCMSSIKKHACKVAGGLLCAVCFQRVHKNHPEI